MLNIWFGSVFNDEMSETTYGTSAVEQPLTVRGEILRTFSVKNAPLI